MKKTVFQYCDKCKGENVHDFIDKTLCCHKCKKETIITTKK